MPAADVTVIIVNHDGGHHVVRCLKCLAVQTSLPARILLLDNASQDDSAAACAQTIAGDERLRHRAQVQRLGSNLGFAAACNRGIDAADTPELSDVDRAFLRHFRRGLEKVGPRLPPMPEAVVRIDRVLRKADCAVSEVADVIRADPVVATKIVGIANSPFYAGLGRIRGVEGAITRMGLRETKSIVQAIALGSRLMRVPGHELEVERLYHHTLAAAVAARIVAQAVHEDPDAAFLGGLIHDIGRSVFLAAVGDFERSNNRRHSPSNALMDHLSDAIHEDLSALVARVWRAGRDIEIAVKFHERPEEAPAGEGQRLALVLGLADDLARYTLEPATAMVPCGDAVRVELAQRLGVRDLDTMAREIDQAAAAFDLPVVSRVPASEAPPPYESIPAPGIARAG